MLKIRLSRVGKKKRPSYRFIISEAARDPYGKALEILGHYNPFTKVCEVDKDRVLYWISKGAQLSPTVHNLMVANNVITGEKVKASKRGTPKEVPAEAAPAEASTTTVESAVAETPAPEAEAPVAEAAPEVSAVETPAEPTASAEGEAKAE